MPNVVVYLKARDEEALRADGHDPKKWVRNAVERALSERGTSAGSEGSEAGDARPDGSAERLSRPATPRSDSADHFKPDPKPGRRS